MACAYLSLASGGSRCRPLSLFTFLAVVFVTTLSLLDVSLLLLRNGRVTGQRNPDTVFTAPDGLVSIVHNVEPYDEDGN